MAKETQKQEEAKKQEESNKKDVQAAELNAQQSQQQEGAKGTGAPELVADNKHVTAPVPGQAGMLDPQPALSLPLSGDPSHQYPGGGHYGSSQAETSQSKGDFMRKLKDYVDAYVPSSPDSRVLFGHGNIHITMGDIRQLVKSEFDD